MRRILTPIFLVAAVVALAALAGCEDPSDPAEGEPGAGQLPAQDPKAGPPDTSDTRPHPLLRKAGDAVLAGGEGVRSTAGPKLSSVIRTLTGAAGGSDKLAELTIDYPADESIFPPEIIPPTFLWHEPSEQADTWLIEVTFGQADPARGKHPIVALVRGDPPLTDAIDKRCLFGLDEIYKPTSYQASGRSWTPGADVWAAIKRHSVKSPATVTIVGFQSDRPGRPLSRGRMTLTTSGDPVGAPIFYRDVPLTVHVNKSGKIQPLGPIALPLIEWRLRDISRRDSRVLLTGMYSCANCHSFSADGKTMGMDVDGPTGDKGAYAIAPVAKQMVIEHSDVMTWNSFSAKPKGHKTIGFMSQVSPDGQYAMTTLNESVYVVNFMNYKFIQVFFPTRGILAYYSRATDEIKPLPGASDPQYVQCDPAWSPRGDYLVFARAKAKDPFTKGRKPATRPNDPNETQIQYDLCRIPFAGGAGGKAEPIEGASANGRSNTFPKVSPDGKWIVFVKCKNGQLMRPDSELWIVPAAGGVARKMRCNGLPMNSWHSFSPSSRWMVFSSKRNTPFTQMFLTHIDEAGNDSPAILIAGATASNRAANIPEFVNTSYDSLTSIVIPAAQHIKYQRFGIKELDENRVEKAKEFFTMAIESDPTYVYARIDLGLILYRQGELEEAKKHLSIALELDPDIALTHHNLGLVFRREGGLDKAVEHFTRALELVPRFGEAHYNLAAVLCDQQKYAESIEHFEAALPLLPKSRELRDNFAAAHNHLGNALVELGKRGQALEHYQKALELDPEIATAHNNAGILLAMKGEFDQAGEHFAKAVQIDPDYGKAQMNLGRVHLTQGKLDPAVVHLKRAVTLQPTNVVAMSLLGDALKGQQNFTEAASWYRKALTESPNDPGAMNSLAWLLATCPEERVRDGREAVKLAQEACKATDNKVPQFLDTLAAAYAEAGRFGDAVNTASRLLNMLGPEHEAMAQQVRRRLQLYKTGKPYRDSPPDGRGS